MDKRILACIAAAVFVLGGCASSGGNGGSESAESSAVTDTAEGGENSAETEEDEQIPQLITFSQESGVYAEGFSLEMTAAEEGDIWYTTDGSDPASSDTRVKYEAAVEIKDRSGEPNVVSAVSPELISGNFVEYDRETNTFPITVSAPADSAVDKCSTISAVLVKADGSTSPVYTRTYFIGTPEQHIAGLAESCKAAGKSLAVVSISMDYEDLFDSAKGIYVRGDKFAEACESLNKNDTDAETARKMPANYNQRGREWERTAQVDFLEYGTDGAESAFSQTCGIRVQGNYSRSDWQKGFRLYARKDYGKKRFTYPVFGEVLKSEGGEVIDSFKTLELRAGGNCAFTAKFNDIYWQDMSAELDCATKASRPCVVYLNGEYWGLYVLEEDYSDDYFEEHYGVNKDEVAVYKGDAETYKKGYKLDEGKLPDGVTDEDYFLQELKDFQRSHKSLAEQADYDAFAELVDTDSVRDYFLAEIWINNKWDWPGKNWSMWRYTGAEHDPANEYSDGKWRFMFYDMEFGGVSGGGDAYANTVREDNYKPKGLLDMGTNNPAVLSYALLMTNEGFRKDFNERLLAMSSGIYEQAHANEVLDGYTAVYSPLYDQFFERYPGSGDSDNAVNGGYASVKCIKDFLAKRADNVSKMTDWIDEQF